MPTINFDLEPAAVLPQPVSVYTRATWADAWTLRPDLIALESVWNLSPDVSTATLHRRYGYVQQPGTSVFATYARETTRGYWVLIVYPPDGGSAYSNQWYWVGYAETPINSNYHPARDGLPETGEQTIPCFGMAKVLDEARIFSTVQLDPDDSNALKRRRSPWTFNNGSVGNRHSAKLTITEGGDTSIAAYPFALPNKTDADFWSTRDIVEHLLAFHLPTPSGLKGTIPFTLTNLAALPDWDRPVVECEDRSVSDILDELLSLDRLLAYTLDPVGIEGTPPVITSINITIYTSRATPLVLPGFTSVPANSNLISVVNTIDPATYISVTADDSDVKDQVIVQGPPEISVCTFRHEDNPDFANANELENDWTTLDQNAYEDGGKLSAGWNALKQYEKRERNEIARQKPELRKVYRRFALKQDWDGTCNQYVAFLEDADMNVYIPYLAVAQFLDRLPLLTGVDYEGDPTLVDETTGQAEIRPLIALKNPSSSKLDDFTRFGRLRDGFQARLPDVALWDMDVAPNNENGPKLDIVVRGAPQHAIAGSGYVGNVADVDQELTFGSFHYNTLTATVAIQGDRRPFWALPADAAVASLDVVRRKVITLDHPASQLVYIAENTIVGYEDDGTEKLSSGGVLRDPMPIIRSLATMYAEHYLYSRNRVEITTQRRPMNFQVGAMITDVSYFSGVNSIIRQIAIRTPLEGKGGNTVTVLAATEAYDPMQLIAPDAFLKPTRKPQGPNKRDKRLARRAALRERQRERAKERKIDQDIAAARAWRAGV